MEIEYKGGNGVFIKVGATMVAVDPNLSTIGLSNPKIENVIQLATEPRFCIANGGEKLTINGPGEYEVSGVAVKGIPAHRHLDGDNSFGSTIYSVVAAGFRIAILGNISPKLTEDQLESIGVVDIAIVPVGGNGYTLDAHDAILVTRQIDPRVVIPVHYADQDLNYEVPQDNIEGFLKELSANQHETVEKLKLKPGSALPAGLTVFEVTRTK